MQTEQAAFPPLPRWLVVFHWVILVNLVAQIFYIGWQVFVVLQPPGVIGPVFGRALDIPPEIMAARRAYAVEGWMALIGLAVYVAITEILPRRLRGIRVEPSESPSVSRI